MRIFLKLIMSTPCLTSSNVPVCLQWGMKSNFPTVDLISRIHHSLLPHSPFLPALIVCSLLLMPQSLTSVPLAVVLFPTGVHCHTLHLFPSLAILSLSFSAHQWSPLWSRFPDLPRNEGASSSSLLCVISISSRYPWMYLLYHTIFSLRPQVCRIGLTKIHGSEPYINWFMCDHLLL